VTAPTYSPPLDELTTAVLHLLRATGRAVFDGAFERVAELEAEDSTYAADPVDTVFPYGVLYQLPGGSADPFPDLDLDLRSTTVPFQATAVSNVRNQCQFVARQFRDQLTARTAAGWTHDLAAPDGWQVIHRALDPAMPGVDRSGDPPRALYSCPVRFAFTITPA
jgi:hypothetical protein